MPNHPHTHKEEPRSWERNFELVLYEYGTACSKADEVETATTSLAEGKAADKVISFIKDLLSTREKEVREEMIERFGKMLEVSTMSEEEVNKILAPYGMTASHLPPKTEIR